MKSIPLRPLCLVVALLLLPVLLFSACGGVAACVGWWCVGIGPCYPYCDYAVDTAYGDFDGDGRIDTASATPGQTMVILRSGTADSSFGEARTFTATSGSSGDFIRAGNFSADANLDLVVVDVAAGQVRAHLGDGAGMFPTQGAPLPLPSLPPIRAVRVGPVNGDAFDDVVLFDFEGGVLVLLSDGAGGFTVGGAGRVSFGSGAVSIALGLLDADGMIDLVVLDGAARTLSAYTGDGTGAWTLTAGPIGVTALPRAAALGEFNGVPGLDLAVVSNGPTVPQLRIYFGNGDGTVTASPQGPVSLHLGTVRLLKAVPDAAAPGGPMDLVAVTGASLYGIPNRGDGTFGTPGALVLTAPIKDVLPTDVNGDAFTDLLITYESGSGVGIALGGTRER